MNQTNLLYKKIGILVGIVAVLAVLTITFTQEKPSSNTPVSTTTDNTTQNTDTSNTSNQNNGVSANTPTPATDTTSVPAPTKPSIPTPTPTPVTAEKKYTYKNGTYTASGPYRTPEGQVAINVTLTITNDVITDANVTSASGDRTSVRYQNRFISGYKQYVVGKSVDSVQLSNVSGSSLTPDGFNTALDTIKTQARV